MGKFLRIIISVVMFALLSGLCFAGGSQDAAGSEGDNTGPLKFALVTDTGGLGDKGYNDSGYQGLLDIKAAYGNVEIKVIETAKVADYEANVRTLSELGYDIIFVISEAMSGIIKKVAPDYPDVNYCIIDGLVEDVPNVLSITHKEQEATFLGGVLAAKFSKTGAFGMVLGTRTPAQERFETGYRAGAYYVNPDANVMITYTGGYSDPNMGKEAAFSMYSSGADIVASCSGANNLGVFEASKQQGNNFWSMGSGSGQAHLAPDQILASHAKKVELSMLEVGKRFMENNGNIGSGHQEFGVKEGGMKLMLNEANPANIPQEILNFVEEVRIKIGTGEIVPPRTMVEFEEFKKSN